MRKDHPKLRLYNYNRACIKEGDCITWEGKSLLSKIIQHWTHRSHVSSVVGKVEVSPHGVKETRRLIIEADQGEVNVRLLSEKLLTYDGKAYLHRLRPQYVNKRPKILVFLWSQVGKKYSYRDLIFNAFRRVDLDCKEYICSALTGASYFQPHNTTSAFTDENMIHMLCTMEYHMLCTVENHKYLRLLAQGKVLRPGGIALLPFFMPEIRIL